MKYENKLSLQIFLLGTIILLIGYYFAYRYNYMTIIQQEFEHTSSLVNELSFDFEQRLVEKVKTNQTLSTTPLLKKELINSNRTYGQYSDKERQEIINLKDNKWTAIKNENNAFILEYTNNEVAQFLKEHQQNLAGEYGEIFVTNKYGVIIASTTKLTTLAHAHKYWWKGAYQNGKGVTFFDDRGYDKSVGGYVLGIVIPIKEANEIIGILKVNLNILGSIGEILTGSKNIKKGKFELIRSGGSIIYDNKNTPLNNRIPGLLLEKIQTSDKTPFLLQDSIGKYIIGISEIAITSKDVANFRFGGSFESVDKIKGNTGESWYIINYRNIDSIVGPLRNYTFILLAFAFLLILIIAIVALTISKQTIKPLKQLIKHSKKIARADFSDRIDVKRKDEIGLLGIAFNKMTVELNKSTTSIRNLESEINQRLKAERDLKEQNKEYATLNEEYKSINKALIIAKVKAEESDQLKSAFLANMSHEIRTPMNGILGFASLLKEPNLSGEQQQKYINIIEKSGDRMLNIINDIISISKIESGQMELNIQESNINEQIEYIYTFFKPEIEAKGIEFKIKKSLSSKEAILKTDRDKVYGILTNLVKNAVKYSKKGEIELGYSKKAKHLEFYVKDTGIGIAKERQEAIFERFIQADITDKMARQGAGLGLSISKAYIEMLGGEIWVTSKEGVGSTFYFTLPYKDEAKMNLKK